MKYLYIFTEGIKKKNKDWFNKESTTELFLKVCLIQELKAVKLVKKNDSDIWERIFLDANKIWRTKVNPLK